MSKPGALAANLIQSLQAYDVATSALPGLRPFGHADALARQLADSIRRVEFAHHLRDAKHHPDRMNPASPIFDPIRAAVLQHRSGRLDEAHWLVFLATHFGKHAIDGWRLVRDVYGRLGGPGLWDWSTVASNPGSFRRWLATNEHALSGGDGVSRRFSNHRKYESLRAASASGTASVIESYVAWVSPPRTHDGLIRDIHREVGQDPREVFDYLYRSMQAVQRFGRLAKFDHLAMLGKLGIAPVTPKTAYLSEATRPARGARLLFTGRPTGPASGRALDASLQSLDAALSVGPQVLEDALCNWQKEPAAYRRFRG